jgi:hypothetical protein
LKTAAPWPRTRRIYRARIMTVGRTSRELERHASGVVRIGGRARCRQEAANRRIDPVVTPQWRSGLPCRIRRYIATDLYQSSAVAAIDSRTAPSRATGRVGARARGLFQLRRDRVFGRHSLIYRTELPSASRSVVREPGCLGQSCRTTQWPYTSSWFVVTAEMFGGQYRLTRTVRSSAGLWTRGHNLRRLARRLRRLMAYGSRLRRHPKCVANALDPADVVRDVTYLSGMICYPPAVMTGPPDRGPDESRLRKPL